MYKSSFNVVLIAAMIRIIVSRYGWLALITGDRCRHAAPGHHRRELFGPVRNHTGASDLTRASDLLKKLKSDRAKKEWEWFVTNCPGILDGNRKAIQA